MSSNEKRSASPIEGPNEKKLKVADEDKAVVPFYPEHYAAQSGRSSPAWPSEMSPQSALNTVIARWTPGHFGPEVDQGTVPTYFAPIPSPACMALLSNTIEPEHEAELESDTEDKPEPKAVGVEEELEKSAGEEKEEKEEKKKDKVYAPQHCQSNSCHQVFTGEDAPANLFNHITDDHIGTRAQKNYDGNCGWGSCLYPGNEKRYLMVSHALRHVPDYKPFSCEKCGHRCQEDRDMKTHMRRKDHQDE